jgi:hypothetical protein
MAFLVLLLFGWAFGMFRGCLKFALLGSLIAWLLHGDPSLVRDFSDLVNTLTRKAIEFINEP